MSQRFGGTSMKGSAVMVAVLLAMIASFVFERDARGSCPAGYPYDCGNGYCCDNAHPTCCAGGQCSATSSCGGGGGGGGGSTCKPGQYLCADQSGCCATGTICGTGTNGCSASSCCTSGGGTGGGGSGGSGGSPTCQSGGTMDGCNNVEACCEVTYTVEGQPFGTKCWYDADGRRFQCGTACTQSDAQSVVDYCTSKKKKGCAVAPRALAGSPLGGGLLFAFALIAGVGAIRRRGARATFALPMILAAGIGLAATGCSSGAETGEDAAPSTQAAAASESLGVLQRAARVNGVEMPSPRTMAVVSPKMPPTADEIPAMLRAP